MDRETARAGETYVLEDAELPLLVFAQLGLLSPGAPVVVDGLVIPVPRVAGLLLDLNQAQPGSLFREFS